MKYRCFRLALGSYDTIRIFWMCASSNGGTGRVVESDVRDKRAMSDFFVTCRGGERVGNQRHRERELSSERRA